MKKLFVVPSFSEWAMIGIHENTNREKLKDGEAVVYETVFRMEWIPGLDVFQMMWAEKAAGRPVWISARDLRLADVLDFMGIPCHVATGVTPEVWDTILLWTADQSVLPPKPIWYSITIE